MGERPAETERRQRGPEVKQRSSTHTLASPSLLLLMPPALCDPALGHRRLTGFLPVVLYLSYMTLTVWILFLAMGTIGFLSSFLFTYGIFNAAKSVSTDNSTAQRGGRAEGCNACQASHLRHQCRNALDHGLLP